MGAFIKGLLICFIVLSISSTSIVTKEVFIEICDNSIDDDGDGLIDLNDFDCECEPKVLTYIPNPSFEDFECCPVDHSLLNCATGWLQPSLGSSDYYHTCGNNNAFWMQPFPDGNGVAGFISGRFEGPGNDYIREYLGTCLNGTLRQGHGYELKFNIGFYPDDPAVDFTVFGSSDCNNLPFSDDVGCPTDFPSWIEINSITLSSFANIPEWKEAKISLNPDEDINALVIGGPCFDTNVQAPGYYFIDDLELCEVRNFEVLDLGDPCDEDFVLGIEALENSSFQWYKEGIAIPGETADQLSQMYGEGNYQILVTDLNSGNCAIETIDYFIPQHERRRFITICEDEEFIYRDEVISEDGIHRFTFEAPDGCDSIITLDVTVLPLEVDTIYGDVVNGSRYIYGDEAFTQPGEYIFFEMNEFGCDRRVILILRELPIYVPNVFTPNGDGVNDLFEIFVASNNSFTYEISILDRWGNLLHKGNKWDGTANGDYVVPGVYIYFIEIETNMGDKSRISGSFSALW